MWSLGGRIGPSIPVADEGLKFFIFVFLENVLLAFL